MLNRWLLRISVALIVTVLVVIVRDVVDELYGWATFLAVLDLILAIAILLNARAAREYETNILRATILKHEHQQLMSNHAMLLTEGWQLSDRSRSLHEHLHLSSEEYSLWDRQRVLPENWVERLAGRGDTDP